MTPEQIKAEYIDKIERVGSEKELADLKAGIFGKSGVITELTRSLKDLPNEEKPAAGKKINDLRVEIIALCDKKEAELHRAAIDKQLNSETLDLSIDKPFRTVGAIHPVNQIKKRLIDYFVGNGYIVYDSPEIETDYYNFQALNIPPDHPARDMQDTFFIGDGMLLRSQTSSGQVRLMEKVKPPLKMICPGRVFRADDDSTHSPVFHQMEGLVVDKNVTLCDLKGALEGFAKFIFGDKTRIRFRPSYFPFTEPSVEVDVSCFNCGGEGCRVCKNTGWIEILGAGMVNRKVLANCGIDPDEYQGFAFGLGLDRITMILCEINDIKLLWENDVRFLRTFRGQGGDK
ncbi:MAG: phenylalanine--tRNA ligase subunit alpha [Clostridiales bacterium]|nr:phenylalanine--tRNA ligase subunit alpha [Clostridiales bacterium]